MAELLYLVDEQDNVIRPIDRDEAHRTLALHRSGISFILNRKKEVFLQHRAPTKKTFPGLYDSTSSFHVAFGESYREAADRELTEECGISVPLEYLGKFRHLDPPDNQIVAVFIGYAEEITRLDPEEAVGGKWCSLESVEKIVKEGKVTPWLRDGYKILTGYLETK